MYSKMRPVSCTNTYHDVTDLVTHGKVKNTKTWTSWEPNINFSRNKKIINLCLRSHILRSDHFVSEVIFNIWFSMLRSTHRKWYLKMWYLKIFKGFLKNFVNFTRKPVLESLYNKISYLQDFSEIFKSINFEERLRTNSPEFTYVDLKSCTFRI